METRFSSKIDGWMVPIIASVGRCTYRGPYGCAGRRDTLVAKWKIPVADIVGVTPSRNPLSSPALSMDRLNISYGKRKFILVSPEDKAGFIRAVEQAKQELQ